jgi:shikimate dehydrogenase
VLGTGGAAKAVFYVLRKLGIEYIVVSRNAGLTSISYDQLDSTILESHTLIINTTPLGMHPHVDTAPDIPYENLSEKHYLFDLVYNPAKTVFLMKGEEQGASIENGADMLFDQAIASWEIWNQRV